MQEGMNLITKGNMDNSIQIITLNLKKKIVNKSLSQAIFPAPANMAAFEKNLL